MSLQSCCPRGECLMGSRTKGAVMLIPVEINENKSGTKSREKKCASTQQWVRLLLPVPVGWRDLASFK